MNDFSTVTRRDLLRAAIALGAAGTLEGLTLFTGGCESCVQQIQNRLTRRNISNLAANDPIIEAYRAAVSAMKQLGQGDPRNWSNQANIHYDHCPHGNWYFLPWHRAYLLYFERICRKLSGYNEFALPYWNWSTNPSIPSVFWGDSNPLFDANRTAGPGDTADPSIVGPANLDTILSEPDFVLFGSGKATGQRDFAAYGQLEGGPHNYVHGFVGGDMGAYHSPLDPVFWTHHNMIDCLWVDWNINLNHANANDTAWTDFTFSGNFVDENGQAVAPTVLETILYPIFSYQFEPCHPSEGTRVLERAALEKFLRAGAPEKLSIERRIGVARSMTAEVDKPAAAAAEIDARELLSLVERARSAAVLTVEGVDAPERSDFFVRVFIGKPDATGSTPMEDAHYAGSFAFFTDSTAMPMREGHVKPGFLVDVTPALRKLERSGGLGLGHGLPVTLVPVPMSRNRSASGQRLTVDRLELAIARF